MKKVFFIFVLFTFSKCQLKNEKAELNSELIMEINKIVEVVIFQDSLNVLKRKTDSRQFCSELKEIKIEIPAKHKKGIEVFPPAPGNRYITDILNMKVNNEPFFEKKDSLHIMTQNLSLKKVEIDKRILTKLNPTSFEKEMVKRKNGKQYNFYNMKIPIFSINKQKAYVELEHRCGSLCGNGRAIFLKKVEGKWKIVDQWEIWTS